jgi:hypothetical protein
MNLFTTKGVLNGDNCNKIKHNSNENISPASSFKSLNEDSLLNQLEPNVTHKESNPIESNDENIKVNGLEKI